MKFFFLGIFVMPLVVFLLGCSHAPQEVSSNIGLTEPIWLKINSEKGHKEVTRYRYDSYKDTHSENKVRVRRLENVEFVMAAEVTNSKQDRIDVRMTTTEKDGTVDLNDLSFPEKGEVIDFIFTPDSKVLRAGGYSEDSIFFVQPTPLPDHAVKKGDTWSMEQRWLSRNNGLPLKLDLIGIFKDVLPCGSSDHCADIEISGRVTVPPGIIRGKLESNIQGHLLFAERMGMVVWSEIRTDEHLLTAEEQVNIKSCMESVTQMPSAYTWQGKTKPYCAP